MKKIILFLVLIFITSFAQAELSKENFSLAGYLKQETSVGLDTFNEVTKFKNILSLSGEYKLSDEFIFFASVKGWYDAVYDWYAKYDPAQDQMGHVQRTNWLRDCYVDYISGPWFIRLGKQQVSWGQADGIAVLDRVNPVDLTEYWLPDMVDIRITLWMLNLNYSPKLNSNLQLLIIPDFEESTSAPPEAPLAFRSYRRFIAYKKAKEAAGGKVYTDIFYPGKQFENSTFGLQWKDQIGDLTYTLNYLNGFYNTARTYLLWGDARVNSNPVAYGRLFKRWRMYGASMNKTFTNPGPLQGITLRGDFAYYNDEPTYYGTDGSSAGVNRWDNIFWLVGIDKYLWTNFLASFQFAQYIMQDAKPGVNHPTTGQPYKTLNAYTYGPQDQVENIFSLKLATDFLHERLKTEVLWSFTDDNQGRLSPKATYELKDNLYLTLGIHYFYGNEQDSNGQYRDNSQFYTQIKFTF